MRLLDKIVLNRLISLITNFILGVLSIIAPKTIEKIDDESKPRKKIFPWRKK